jgi:hypothetical protein
VGYHHEDDRSLLYNIEEPEEILSVPQAEGVTETMTVNNGAAVSFNADGSHENEQSIAA